MLVDTSALNAQIISNDTDSQLIARLIWYAQNFSHLDNTGNESFELIKAEILRRMHKEA